MSPENFAHLAGILKDRSGLIVALDKGYLLEARLAPVLRKHGLPDLDALAAAVRVPSGFALIDQVVDAMTTNETSFFRDRNPFEALRVSILPQLIAARSEQHSLRIWSAACSTGQEPYSVAILLRDQFPMLSDWRVEIVATDISPSALERAREGIFSPFEVQRGLPVHLLVRHFEQVNVNWRIRPEFRQMISFRQFNLLGDIAALGRFDIVLCRNVLIYFDLATKAVVLDRIARMLVPDGALLLGGSESVFGVCDGLQEVTGQRSVYAPALLTGKPSSRSSASHSSARTAS